MCLTLDARVTSLFFFYDINEIKSVESRPPLTSLLSLNDVSLIFHSLLRITTILAPRPIPSKKRGWKKKKKKKNTRERKRNYLSIIGRDEILLLFQTEITSRKSSARSTVYSEMLESRQILRQLEVIRDRTEATGLGLDRIFSDSKTLILGVASIPRYTRPRYKTKRYRKFQPRSNPPFVPSSKDDQLFF